MTNKPGKWFGFLPPPRRLTAVQPAEIEFPVRDPSLGIQNATASGTT
jgi:hypothetical protein